MAQIISLKTGIKDDPDIEPRLPRPVSFFFCAAWALAVLYIYHARMGFLSLNPLEPPVWLANIAGAFHLAAYLPQLAFALMFAAFSLSAGGILLNAVAGADNKDIGGLDWLCFSMGLGFGALGMLTLGLGFLGLYNKPAIFSLACLGILAGAVRFRRDFYGRVRQLLLEIKELRFSWFDGILILVLFLYAATAFTWALTPEIFFDSLVYHLGVPNYYLREGRIAAVPFNIHSGLPLLVQMIYTAGLIISDEILAKLLHFSIGLCMAGALFSIGRRYVSATAGLLAGVVFLSMPMAAINLATSGIDVASCWFTLLAAYALLLFTARTERREPRLFDRTLLLAGIFAGLACGTKYQAMFTAVSGLAVLAFAHFTAAERGAAGMAAGQALFYGAAAGLVFLPWPIKNSLFHGNPLYPFFGKIFGGQQVDPVKWTIFLGDGFSRSMSAVFTDWNELGRFILHPWHLTFSGMGSGDFVGPFILMSLPLVVLFRLKNTALRHMSVFVAVMWLLWCVSTSMPRFFLQGLSVFSVLIAALMDGSADKRLKWLFRSLLILVSCYSLRWLNEIEKSQEGWQVVFGLQDRERYLSRRHSYYPSAYYPAMKFINDALPPESRVLFAGETRGFYCKRRFIAPSVNDVHTLALFARESSTPEEMQAKMAAAGITHIFLNLAEAARLDKNYHLFQWDAASLRIFDAWWDRYVRLVWSDVRPGPEENRWLFIYGIASVPGPARGARTYNYFDDLYRRSL